MHQEKSLTTSYLLWFFFGGLGAHRLYLNQTKTAGLMFLLAATAGYYKGFLPLIIILTLWWLVDAFLIPRYVDSSKDNSQTQRVDTPKVDRKKATALPKTTAKDFQQIQDMNTDYMECFKSGDLAAAITGAVQALELCESKFGKENSQAGTIRNNLGEFYRLSGNNPQAINMLKSAITIQENHPDPESTPEQAQDTLCHSINSLAHIYTSLGQAQDARKLYRNILDILSKSSTNQIEDKPTIPNAAISASNAVNRSPKYYVNYANALNNLAKLHSDKEQHEQAQPLFVEAMALLDHFPLESTELKVDILKNIATQESMLQRYDHAESLYQRAITTLEDYAIILDKQPNQQEKDKLNIKLASNYDELNVIYDEQHRPQVDEEKLRADAIKRNQIQIAACRNGLGITYANRDRLEDAEIELSTAARIRRLICPANDPEFITGLGHLGLVYFKLQKLDKAEAVSKHILAARAKTLGEGHADTQRAQRNLEVIQAEMIKGA